MITSRNRTWILALVLFSCLIQTGCKKCRPPGERRTTITGVQWRLVEADTTDGNFEEDLDNWNFLLFEFGTDFLLNIYKVEQNTQIETPIITGEFRVDPEFDEISIEYVGPTGSEVRDYEYKLGRGLELFDVDTNDYYRFVVYTGAIEPDNSCTF